MGPSKFRYFHHSLIALFLVCLLPIESTSAVPPDDCLAYAYTESENHAFLIQVNSSNFGNTIKIKTDCEQLQLSIDGFVVASSTNESYFEYQVEQGRFNVSLYSPNGFSEEYNGVSFYPDRLGWEFEWLELSGANIQYVNVEEADLKENWASFLSVVIAWFLSTYVLWQLVQTYVQRNFIEEVTS